MIPVLIFLARLGGVRTVLISAVALLAALTSACGGGDERAAIVAGFYPLAFAVEELAPDEDVANLTPPGVEPHDLELSARSVETIADADLVVYVGAGFQEALERAVDSTGAKAVDVLEGIELREETAEHGHEEPAHEGEEPEREHEGEARDPHVWLDPVLYERVVRRIASALDPPADPASLAAELRELDAEYRRGLRDCERRELVTSHAAFGYLAERYGLEQVPITGLSPEAEPTPGELRAVVEEVREHGATTIFFETLVSPRLAETVAREVGATTAVLNPLEGLTEDELDGGEDYFSVMRENLDALRRGLSCR
jgi:zinc transport system substrate-binding protein